MFCFPDAPPISQAPILMLRPRAWNMVEHCMMVLLNYIIIKWRNVFILYMLISLYVFCYVWYRYRMVTFYALICLLLSLFKLFMCIGKW